MPSREWLRLSDEDRATIGGHQGAAPVKVSGIARELALAVRASTLPPGVSGEIRPDGAGGFVVKVNRHDSEARQRFTVAHEVAHFLLHRHLIGNGITDDALYRSPLSDAIEAEANRLAADILMPETLLRVELQLAREQRVENILEHMAEMFGVSEAAMKIRLGL